jgi:hypothetical protein
MEEDIKAAAEMAVEQLRPLSGFDFGYTEQSVEWLEGYIERLRNSDEFASLDAKSSLIGVFGSFLGECIIRCYGGSWAKHEGAWCVAFNSADMAFPFAKVAKQFDNGLSDGISSFFRLIPILFEGRASAQAPPPQKRWWKIW